MASGKPRAKAITREDTAKVVTSESLGDTSVVRALQRGIRLLGCFDSEHPEWGAVELADHLGLPRATTFRLLSTLRAEGLVSLSSGTGRYSLGPNVFQMAYVWVSEAALARIAAPHLERLSTVSGETATLSVWTPEGPLRVAVSSSPRPFRFPIYVGQTFRDAANAHSKVLLAFGPEYRRTEMLSRRLDPLTPFTITDQGRLRDELCRVVEEGVAFDLQEQQLGICAIGVPVWDYSGEVRASLALLMIEEQYRGSEVKRYVQALKQLSAALSYDLGFRGDPYANSGRPA